jgi:serpin B
MAGFRGWLRKSLGINEASVPGLSGSEVPSGAKPSAEESNTFALAIYRLLRRSPENLFFSPFSVRSALGMAQGGARGETAAQMREALRFSSSDEALHAALAETIQRLNVARRGEYEMAVANSLWGQDGGTLQPEFLDLMVGKYGCGVNLVDFRSRSEAAHMAINHWVEDKTSQKIQDLIPSGTLDADTRLVLVNAVYFKGMWEMPFQRATTRDERFFLANGREVLVPLMHQDQEVRYLQGAGYQAVDLVYRGGDLSLLVLLPERKNGLEDLEKRLSVQMLKVCASQMATRRVRLFLPRFKVTWGTINLRDHLSTLGMRLAFVRYRADFSGINGRKPPDEESLFLSAVFHKAFVAVDEEGTEAAAATAVVTTMVGAALFSKPQPDPIFRADHPFLYAIRDRKSGTILFLGRMADPSREG